LCAAFVAGHDAPLIGERAATRTLFEACRHQTGRTRAVGVFLAQVAQYWGKLGVNAHKFLGTSGFQATYT